MVSCFKQSIEEFLLNDWVPNLHGMAELIRMGIRQFCR